MKNLLSEKNAIWASVILALIAVFIAYADYKKPSDIDSLISVLAKNPELTERALAAKSFEIANLKKPPLPRNKNTKHTQLIDICFFHAAETYKIHPAILIGIYLYNGKKYTDKVLEKNKIGHMGIPEIVLDELASQLSSTKEDIINQIESNKCTSIMVAAWLIEKNYNLNSSYKDSIKLYNNGSEISNLKFYEAILQKLKDQNLIAYE